MGPDILVIRAGVGGMTAAIRLAEEERRMLVLERNTSVGGEMAEWTEEGFR